MQTGLNPGPKKKGTVTHLIEQVMFIECDYETGKMDKVKSTLTTPLTESRLSLTDMRLESLGRNYLATFPMRPPSFPVTKSEVNIRDSPKCGVKEGTKYIKSHLP